MSKNLAADAIALLDQVILMVDEGGVVRFAGGAVAMCCGRNAEDLVGRPLGEALCTNGVSTDAMLSHLAQSNLWVTHCCNREGQPLELRLRTHPDRTGTVVTIRLLTADERTSNDQLEQLSQVLEPAGIGVWTHDATTGRVWYSPLAYAITGLPTTHPLDATSLVPFLGSAARTTLAEAVAAHMATGAPYRPIFDLQRADGTTATIQLFGTFQRSADGRPKGWFGGVRDLTGQTALESQLVDLRQQLEHIQRIEGLGLFTTAIAHDFNNLLTAILGCIEVIDEAPELRDGTREDLALARDATVHACTLTQQLLRYGRKTNPGPVIVDLHDMLVDVAGFLRRTLPTGVGLSVARPDRPLQAHLDPCQLQQVLTNLITNAGQAIEPPGRIHLALSEDDGFATIDVHDTGAGMSADTLDRVFDPFFTTRTDGTGLGLATCRQIVEHLGGTISARSTLGVGSCFTVRVPRATSPAHAPIPVPEVPGGTESVVVVEQDHLVRRVTNRLLELAGYTVRSVHSAADALDAIETVAPALVIVDLYLPLTSGPRLVDQIQAKHPETRVLYTTSAGPHTGHPDLPDEHTTPILPKPYARDTLLRAVRGVLDR